MDGSKRAKTAVSIHLLKHLGWITPTVAQTLEESFLSVGKYSRLEAVGELSLA